MSQDEAFTVVVTLVAVLSAALAVGFVLTSRLNREPTRQQERYWKSLHNPDWPKERVDAVLSDLPPGWLLVDTMVMDPRGRIRAWSFDHDREFLAQYVEGHRIAAGMEPIGKPA